MLVVGVVTVCLQWGRLCINRHVDRIVEDSCWQHFVCMSVCPHGTVRSPLDGLLLKFILGFFFFN
jgi:NAD-dependent dihydropyrimidine dehydrogenase PreA subunit